MSELGNQNEIYGEETIILNEEEIMPITFNYQEDKINKMITSEFRKYSILSFNSFLLSFVSLIMGLLFFRFFLFLSVLMMIIAIILALVTMINYYTTKIARKDLLTGYVKVTLYDDYLKMEEQYEKVYISSTIDYQDIKILNETDDMYSVTTKYNRMYLLDKEALGEQGIAFKTKVLNNAIIYNDIKIKKSELEEGFYDYYPEGSQYISKIKARNKASNSLLYLVSTFMLTVMLGIHLKIDIFWILVFVPLEIIELIYLGQINKKLPKKGKLIMEKVFTILMLVYSLLIGCLGLLFKLLESL